jgi:hypothetical protein
MSDQEKNTQSTNQPVKNDKKTPIIITIVLILIACFVGVLMMNRHDPVASPSNKYPDELDGNYIFESGNDGIYFDFDNDDSKIAMYVIKNNKIDSKSTGTYYFNLENDGKIDVYWDDSGEEKVQMTGHTDNSITLKLGKDELEFSKFKKSSKKFDKINKIITTYEKEKTAKEKAEAEANAPKEFTVGAGNYTCGEDFNAGTYDISLVSGSGNVISDGENSVNEIFGSDESNDEISSYSNAKFDDGDTLEVSGSVRIKLTPKK